MNAHGCHVWIALRPLGAGVRYTREGHNDDLCEKHFWVLPPAERASYDPISEPETFVVIDAKFYGNVARFLNHAEPVHANLNKCNVYAYLPTAAQASLANLRLRVCTICS